MITCAKYLISPVLKPEYSGTARSISLLQMTRLLALPGHQQSWYLLDTGWAGRYPPRHDDVIKWKHFLCLWPIVREIHRSPVGSPHKGQWSGALKFSLVWAWTGGWANNRGAGDLRCHRAYYDVTAIRKDFNHTHDLSAEKWYKY